MHTACFLTGAKHSAKHSCGPLTLVPAHAAQLSGKRPCTTTCSLHSFQTPDRPAVECARHYATTALPTAVSSLERKPASTGPPPAIPPRPPRFTSFDLRRQPRRAGCFPQTRQRRFCKAFFSSYPAIPPRACCLHPVLQLRLPPVGSASHAWVSHRPSCIHIHATPRLWAPSADGEGGMRPKIDALQAEGEKYTLLPFKVPGAVSVQNTHTSQLVS